jgi:outer membrane protein OmpA-like peptidoglycan-associated protein
VNVPILFVQGTDQLLDRVSLENVAEVAKMLREIFGNKPGARFCIQGHASAEGTREENQVLSDLRAIKIFSLLTSTYGIPARNLNRQGFGPDFARFPANAPEYQLQMDRRVLLVEE